MSRLFRARRQLETELTDYAARDWGLRSTPVVEVVKRARGSVVNIHSERTVAGAADPFGAAAAQNRVNGMGTGIIIDARGYIVTNQHVVEDVSAIRVRLADGSAHTARVVARDHTVRVARRRLDIPPGPGGRSYAGCRVEVRECLDGRFLAVYQGRLLAEQPSPSPDFVLIPRHQTRGHRLSASQRPSRTGGRYLRTPETAPSRAARARASTAARPGGPAAAHPWRRAFTRRGRQIARTPKPGGTFSRNS